MVRKKASKKKAIKRVVRSSRRKVSSARVKQPLASLLPVALYAEVFHEINNHVAVIQASAETLLEGLEENSSGKDGLFGVADRIARVTERMSRILGKVRNITRDSSCDPFETVIVENVVDQVVEFASRQLEVHLIKVEKRSLPGISFKGHPYQIEQVLLNLIRNSVDAIAGSENPWIEIASGNEKGNVFISVTDSGKGIPKNILNHLMKPFFTTKSAGRGTGLGLSISRRIVREHGGKLFVDTTCSNTRFVITLPRSC